MYIKSFKTFLWFHKHLNVWNNLYQTLKSRLCYSNDIMDDITLAKRLFVRQYCHSCSYNCIGKSFSVFFLYFLFHALWPEHAIFVHRLCFIFSSRMPKLQILCMHFLSFFHFSPKLVLNPQTLIIFFRHFSQKEWNIFCTIFLKIVSFKSHFSHTIDF